MRETYPGLGFDPTPGVAPAVAAVVERLVAGRAAVSAAARTLARSAGRGGWRGPAAAGYRAETAELARAAAALGQAFDLASGVLAGWAERLVANQRTADQLDRAARTSGSAEQAVVLDQARRLAARHGRQAAETARSLRALVGEPTPPNGWTDPTALVPAVATVARGAERVSAWTAEVATGTGVLVTGPTRAATITPAGPIPALPAPGAGTPARTAPASVDVDILTGPRAPAPTPVRTPVRIDSTAAGVPRPRPTDALATRPDPTPSWPRANPRPGPAAHRTNPVGDATTAASSTQPASPPDGSPHRGPTDPVVRPPNPAHPPVWTEPPGSPTRAEPPARTTPQANATRAEPPAPSRATHPEPPTTPPPRTTPLGPPTHPEPPARATSSPTPTGPPSRAEPPANPPARTTPAAGPTDPAPTRATASTQPGPADPRPTRADPGPTTDDTDDQDTDDADDRANPDSAGLLALGGGTHRDRPRRLARLDAYLLRQPTARPVLVVVLVHRDRAGRPRRRELFLTPNHHQHHDQHHDHPDRDSDNVRSADG